MSKLLEDNRQQLISKSKISPKGKERFIRRHKSKVINTVKAMNSIDMNKLFKEDILTVNIPVQGETNNYTVKITFGGFLEILKDQLKGKETIEFKDICKACIIGFNRDDVFISCTCPDFCLHSNTKIRLPNEQVYTIEELYNKFQNNEDLYVYSINDNKEVVKGKVTDIWISGLVNELVKVTLNNNQEILTTKNHRYMLSDGSYIEAEKLEVGTSLMTIDPTCIKGKKENRTVKSIEIITYDKDIPVYDLSVDKYNNFYVDAGVVLHNCYRFAYWVTRNKVNSGAPETRPSNKTNPHDTLGSACKHVLLVLNNSSWIIKVASTINNYIKYMENNYPKLYADILYPAIFNKKYEEPVQLSFDDNDDKLAGENDTDTLDKANTYNQQRTKFQPGNTQGVRFAKEPNKNQLSFNDIEENPDDTL